MVKKGAHTRGEVDEGYNQTAGAVPEDQVYLIEKGKPKWWTGKMSEPHQSKHGLQR